MAVMLFFAVAMGVNDQQDEDDCATNQEHEDNRLVPPYFRHKAEEILEKIGIHPFPIYIRPNENQKRKVPAVFPAAGRALNRRFFPYRDSGGSGSTGLGEISVAPLSRRQKSFLLVC